MELLSPTESRCLVNGIEMCYFEWGDDSDPTVLLLHATGFHARCWDQVIANLPNPVHVIAPDLRGHGRTQNQPPYAWNTFSQDIVELIDSLSLEDIVIAGHSMGGRCAIDAAANKPNLVKSLVLVDPVVMSPDLYSEGVDQNTYANIQDHPIANRRSVFKSVDAMFDRFKDRHPFSVWKPEVLRDYCQYGLLFDGTNYQLACPPTVEATIYTETAKTPPLELISSVNQPAVVLRAKERIGARTELDFSLSPTWPQLAETMPNAEDQYLPHLTHFIPMEDPSLVAREIDKKLG